MMRPTEDWSDQIAVLITPITSVTKDVVPNNGVEIMFYDYYASVPPLDGSFSVLIWDAGGASEEMLYMSNSDVHGTSLHNKTVIGDGSKILRMELKNEYSRTACLMMGFHAVRIESDD